MINLCLIETKNVTYLTLARFENKKKEGLKVRIFQ